MKKPPMGDWVKRGVSVVCSTGFTMDFPTGVPGSLTICNSSPHPHAPDDDIFTKSVIIVCNGTPGRVLSVGSRNVKVYLTSNDDKTPNWTGEGDPVEPYWYSTHEHGDFICHWDKVPPRRTCLVCGFSVHNERHWRVDNPPYHHEFEADQPR